MAQEHAMADEQVSDLADTTPRASGKVEDAAGECRGHEVVATDIVVENALVVQGAGSGSGIKVEEGVAQKAATLEDDARGIVVRSARAVLNIRRGVESDTGESATTRACGDEDVANTGFQRGRTGDAGAIGVNTSPYEVQRHPDGEGGRR